MSVRKIATRLNISPSTVSLALRGDLKISSHTRERVKKEAARIGYRCDAKLNELMAQVRLRGLRPTDSCLGVLSFSRDLRPWEKNAQARALYEAMADRAERLGYRLEPFRVNEDGMSLSRLRSILDTRRIQGVFCFGDQGAGESFPEELLGLSVVSLGMGFGGKLNCVAPDYFGDMLKALESQRRDGVEHPALVLDETLDEAIASRYLGAFCGGSQRVGWSGRVFRFSKSNASLFSRWLSSEEPDALIWAGRGEPDSLLLKRSRLDERDLPVVSLNLESEQGLGLRSSAPRMGERAVDMLVRCVTEQEVGLPEYPRIELVGSEWVDTREKSNGIAILESESGAEALPRQVAIG